MQKNTYPAGFSRFRYLLERVSDYPENDVPLFNAEEYNNYLHIAKKDLEVMVADISKAAQIFDGSWKLADYKVSDGLQLQASATVTEKGKPVYFVSLGTLLALDDLFLRFLSEKRFFVTGLANANDDLPDIDCMWTGRRGSKQPAIRYFDYNVSEDIALTPELILQGIDPSDNFSPALFEAIPVNEPEKIEIAASLTQIALAWILLHEETHYLEGHLHYLADRFPSFKGKSETGNHFSDISQQTVSRLMEWQADKYAAHGIIDVFLSDVNLLPLSYTKDGLNVFYNLRLLMTSIGCATMIFERAGMYNGTSNEYPKPRTRLMTIMRGCVSRTQTSALFSKGQIDSQIIVEAILHTLYDIYAGSLMTPAIETSEDRIKALERMPNTFPTENIRYIESLSEIVRIFYVGFQGRMENEEDEILAQNWIREIGELIDLNNSFFYAEMSVYGDLAKSDFKKL